MIYQFSLYGFLKNLRLFEPFLLLIFREDGLTFFQIGLLYSVRDLTTNIMEIPSGIFADAFGKRLSMLMSLTAYIISFLVFYFFKSFYALGAAMLLFGIGEAFRSGTHKALIFEYLNIQNRKNERVSYYGKTRSASQFGSAINSLLAAALVFYTGNYRYVFLATVLPYVINLFNLWTYPAELDGVEKYSKEETLTQQFKDTLKSFLLLFKDKEAMRAILNSAGFAAFFKSSKDYLQPIIKTFALSLPVLLAYNDKSRTALIIGAVYFIIYILTSLSSRSAGRIDKKLANLALAINITFWIGAGFVFFSGLVLKMKFSFLAVLGFVGLYIVFNIRKPMSVAFISEQIKSRVMVSGLSAESQITTVFMALLLPLLGFLADSFGLGIALISFGGLMLVFSFFSQLRKQITE